LRGGAGRPARRARCGDRPRPTTSPTGASARARSATLADAVVDAKGDLDLCAPAGLEFEADAKTGGGEIAHCLNTGWLWAGVDFARWLRFEHEKPDAHRALIQDAGGWSLTSTTSAATPPGSKTPG
jgi:hypothetical protein